MSMPHSPLVTQRTINAIRRVLAVLVVIATVTALNNQWEYAANPPYKGVFPYGTGDNVGSINSISVQVDAAGGMHAAYAGYYTGLVGDIDTKSGYYSYCAP